MAVAGLCWKIWGNNIVHNYGTRTCQLVDRYSPSFWWQQIMDAPDTINTDKTRITCKPLTSRDFSLSRNTEVGNHRGYEVLYRQTIFLKFILKV
ncbi:hypothetical protein C0J52_00093 [Blattella germanica]|nr:hypothetical protein C0J52_00093 [Blattella germanica]